MLKNKILLNKFEDLINFIQWFMNQAAFHLTTRSKLWGVIQNEFTERRVGQEVTITKKRSYFGQEIFSGEPKGKRFIMQIASSSSGGR